MVINFNFKSGKEVLPFKLIEFCKKVHDEIIFLFDYSLTKGTYVFDTQPLADAPLVKFMKAWKKLQFLRAYHRAKANTTLLCTFFRNTRHGIRREIDVNIIVMDVSVASIIDHANCNGD